MWLWIATFVGVAALLLAIPASAQSSGRIVTIPAVPTRNIAAPCVTIWLPSGYDTGQQRYGVVYMADGQNLFGASGKTWAVDRSIARLTAAKRIDPVIVVGIDHAGAGRFRQYMPVEPLAPPMRAAMEKQLGRPLEADAYLRFLTDDLKPLIDREFRTRADRRHTAIAGSSMGGLIAFYALAMRPETFGRAASLSTHWPIEPPSNAAVPPMRDEVIAMWRRWVAQRVGKPHGRRVWFDHGDRTLDRWYAPYQQAVDGELTKLGWRRGHDVESRIYPGAAHDEASWAARLDEVFAWLLR